MAGVWVRGTTVWVSFGSGENRRRFPLTTESTAKANIRRLEKDRRRIIDRWKEGENLDDLIAEWQGFQKDARTLGYYAQYFLDEIAPHHVRTSTLMDYVSAYNAHWLPFDQMRIDQIRVTDLRAHLNAKGISKKRQRNVWSVLRMIFDGAVQDGVFQTNPILAIKKSKQEALSEPDPYTKQERDMLLAWLEAESRIAWRYFLMGFYTGMRTGELLGAAWENYSPPFLLVNQEMVRRALRPYTKTQARSVPIPGIVQNMLRNGPKKGLIHVSPQGRMFKDADWLMAWWKRAHTATETPLRRDKLYPWRSTYISLNISAGVPAEDVANWAGNSVDIIRKHYLKYLPDTTRQNALIAQMENALK